MAGWHGPSGLTQEYDVLHENIWLAPLVPVALAFTVGILLDRYLEWPFALNVLIAVASLVAFLISRRGAPERLSLAYLFVAGVALASAYHHYRQNLYPEDDIGTLVRETPTLVTLHGVLDEEPRRLPVGNATPLQSQPTPASASTILSVTRLIEQGQERIVSGRVRVFVTAEGNAFPSQLLANLHPGDEVRITGQLRAFAPRSNPGEFDLANYWHVRAVHAQLSLRRGNRDVERVREGWRSTFHGWVGVIRAEGHQLLDRCLNNESIAALARALLLGEGAPMRNEDWQKYVRTGVVHVLAISGQHLVVVAWFLWTLFRCFGVRQRKAAIVVALVLLAYAILTGGRPPAMRAAVGAGMLCIAVVIDRPVITANLFALAWIVVALLQPTDVFEQGCQLSFVAVAVLCWGTSWILAKQPDALEEAIDEARPAGIRLLRQLAYVVYESYAICLIVWVAITPLAAHHTGVVAPVAIVLGPPLTLLTSIALLAGFLVLLLAPISPALATVPAWLVNVSLTGCERIVDLAERWPVHLYIGEIPQWWVIIFYLGLFAVLLHAQGRLRWRWAVPPGLAWLCLVLLMGAVPANTKELRCTFLSVGHGTAIVMELPDGRTVLYDAGSIRGPTVASRIIAPFLWSRKIARLDDVILSHADLDHFNGLVELAERFPIGRVLTSTSFVDKNNAAVRHVMETLERRRIRLETVQAGDRLTSGDMSFEVLHPPQDFRGTTENTRSLVVDVRHRGHSILLTGDLEKVGLDYLLQSPSRKVDILMAPHHGSTTVNGRALVAWCKPGLVLSCQGTPRGKKSPEAIYRHDDVEFWMTEDHGAITVRSRESELLAESYHHGKRWHRSSR